MILTISATLNDEQVALIAQSKGYSDTVGVEDKTETTDENGNVSVSITHSSIPNPQSPADYVCKKYEEMIVEDAKSIFLSFSRKQKEEEQMAEEQAIRDTVTQSITSTVC